MLSFTWVLKALENKKTHLECVYQSLSQENNSINNNVTVTKVTDNKIIPPLGMIAITQCMSETSSYQARGQG